MILKVISVYDVKAKAYRNVNFFRTLEEGIRSFSREANNKDTEFFEHAEDFVLMDMGTFNDDTGEFVLHRIPVSVITALDASQRHKEFYASVNLKQVVND